MSWRLFRRDRDERDLADEIRFDLDEDTRLRVERGESPEEAHRASRRDFGSVARVQEETREMWGWSLLETFVRDLKFAVRLLVKNPSFSAVAILTLALGIGANTAIFSVVNALLIEPLPFRDSKSLVALTTVLQRYNTDRGAVSYLDILEWKEKRDLFDAVATWNPAGFDVTGGSAPETITGIEVDREYFRVMTDAPLVGRTFADQEDEAEANRVVVLSYGLWMRRFGGDKKAVGSSIDLNDTPHEIVGVMPPQSIFPLEAEIVKPLGFGAAPPEQALRRDNHAFRAVARLRSGVSVERAQAELTAMGDRIAGEDENRAGTNLKAYPLREFIVGQDLSRTLWLLLGAVLTVLLIACINVANLLLARGAARQREVAVRNVLGAGWGRLAGQFLAESLALAIAGGALGIAMGYAGSKALVRFAPPGVPRLDAVGVDLSVVAFTGGICLLTAIVFGLLPITSVRRAAAARAVQEGGRSSSGGVRAGRLRSALVISELALAVILLSAAGLLLRSFTLLQRVETGFDTEGLLTARVALPDSRYGSDERVIHSFRQIVDNVRRLPGVSSVSATSSLPLSGGGWYLGRVFLAAGQPEPPGSSDTAAQWSVVQPGCLKTMGVPIIAGREFDDRDTAESNPVIVVNESMARRMFPNESAIGKRIRSWRDEDLYREIVGVVGDLRFFGLDGREVNSVFVPHTQDSWRMQMLVARTTGDPRDMLRAVQSAIWEYDSKLAISDVETMTEILNANLARPRFSAFLLAAFAATALLMGAIGIYGLVSYVVAQQTKEIGIRMALGAVRGDILRAVTGRALALAGTGVAVGVAGALGVTRLMETMLFGVSATDAGAFGAAALLLLATAGLASYVPARRASKADPLTALRYE